MNYLSATYNSIASSFQPTDESDLAYGSPSKESKPPPSTPGNHPTLVFTSYVPSKFSGGKTLPGYTAMSVISSTPGFDGEPRSRGQSWKDAHQFRDIARGVVDRNIHPEIPETKSIDPSQNLAVTNESEMDYEKRVRKEVNKLYSDFHLADQSRNFDIKPTDWADFIKVVPLEELSKLPFLPHNYEDPKEGSKSKQG